MCQVATVLDAGLMWQVIQGLKDGNRACHRKKTVGEPYEGKPHVRFEVAGDGNQDMSQAPSPDPTSRPGCARGKRGPGNRAVQPDCLENAVGVLHIC